MLLSAGTFFEIITNLLESVMFFSFLSLGLEWKKLFPYSIVFWIICRTVLISATNLLLFPPYIAANIFNVIEILFIALFSLNPISEKLLWYGISSVIFSISDVLSITLGYTLTSYLPHNSAHDVLIPGTMARYIAFVSYLLIYFVLMLLVLHHKNSFSYFPVWLRLLFLLTILAGTYAIEKFVSILVLQSENNSSAILLVTISFTAIFALVIFLTIWISRLYQNNLNLLEKNKQHELERQQFSTLTNTVDTLRSIKHDFHEHLFVLSQLLTSGKPEEARIYLTKFNENLSKSSFGISTGNSILDAILSTKMTVMKKLGIRFSYSIYLPDHLPLEDILLTSVIGNLFENAITACRQVDTPPFIRFGIQPKQNNLTIQMANSSNGIYLYDKNGNLATQKKEIGHGLGLKRVRQIVEEADGFCQIMPMENSFLILLVIPLSDS